MLKNRIDLTPSADILYPHSMRKHFKCKEVVWCGPPGDAQGIDIHSAFECLKEMQREHLNRKWNGGRFANLRRRVELINSDVDKILNSIFSIALKLRNEAAHPEDRKKTPIDVDHSLLLRGFVDIARTISACKTDCNNRFIQLVLAHQYKVIHEYFNSKFFNGHAQSVNHVSGDSVSKSTLKKQISFKDFVIDPTGLESFSPKNYSRTTKIHLSSINDDFINASPEFICPHAGMCYLKNKQNDDRKVCSCDYMLAYLYEKNEIICAIDDERQIYLIPRKFLKKLERKTQLAEFISQWRLLREAPWNEFVFNNY